jgi:hypothetical protein
LLSADLPSFAGKIANLTTPANHGLVEILNSGTMVIYPLTNIPTKITTPNCFYYNDSLGLLSTFSGSNKIPWLDNTGNINAFTTNPNYYLKTEYGASF